MSHNLITPNATRILCSQITVHPFVGAMNGQSAVQTFCAVVYGDAIFIFWGNLKPVSVLRVKADGSWCWYLSDSPARSVLGNTFTCIQSSENTFTLGTVGSKFASIIIPNHFVANGVVNFSYTLFSLPPSPCGAPFNTVDLFYAKNGDVLIEYIEAFPEAYNLSALTANVNANGIAVDNSGTCGNFSNNESPLVDTSNSIQGFPLNQGYGGSNTYSFDIFGNQIYRDISFTDLHGNFLGVYNSKLMRGSLNCAGTGKFPFYSATEQYVYDTQNAVFNGFLFKSAYSSGAAGGTDLACSCISNSNAAVMLFNGPYFVELATLGGGNHFCGVYLKSGVWVGIRVDGTTVTINTPLNPLPDGILNPPPIMQSNMSSSLLNWHRPISTRGLFKT